MDKFYWLNEESRQFLSRGYLLPGVTVEQRIEQIGKYAESILGIDGFSDKFYDYMSRGWFSLSTPVWANFGLDRGLGISCFGVTIKDDLSDILRASCEIGMLCKYGGGTAGYFGNLRHRGSEIKNNGFSSGAVHFMEIFETIANTISQGSARRGHFAAYLPASHPDVMEFLNIKDEGNNIQDISIAVTVDADFKQRLLNRDPEAESIWVRIIQKRFETGYPYIFFEDNVNNNKPQVYKDAGLDIKHSQMCVSGDTQILTDKGYEIISDLVGDSVNVWNGEEWSDVTVFKTGENQELVRVHTDSGYTLDCTPYHKFYVQNGNSIEEKVAAELKDGDKLIKFDLPIIYGEKELHLAYANGFYSGDGCLTPQGQRIYLYGEKMKLAAEFTDCIDNWYVQSNHNRMYGHTKSLKDKFFVPDATYTVESRIKWLSGLLDADGCVTNNNGSQALQIGSVEKEFLLQIQLMLQTLGVDSKIKKAREEGSFLLPKNDGSGELKEYNCKEVNRLLINGNSLFKLSQLGLSCKRLTWEIKLPFKTGSRYIKIDRVEKLEGQHDTFCFTEPKRHMGMFNGILTGQCSEILEYTDEQKSFTCCLSSMNLLHFDEWKDTDAVEVLTYLLDSILTDFINRAKNIPFLEKTVLFAEEHRSIGLGVLGYHSYLQSKMIPFEGIQAQILNNLIFKNINDKSLKASKFLATRFGEPKMLKGYGERFTTRLAIAPTTSSSFILGQVSPSIEPLNSNYFLKDLAKGKFPYRNPYLKEVLSKYEKDTEDTWHSILMHGGSVQHLKFLSDEEKMVFKTFGEISQLEIVRQAASRQKHIDQGQSLNLMIHPDTPVHEVHSLLMEAWDLGIKTLYYQRSANKAQEVSRDLMNCVSCEA